MEQQPERTAVQGHQKEPDDQVGFAPGNNGSQQDDTDLVCVASGSLSGGRCDDVAPSPHQPHINCMIVELNYQPWLPATFSKVVEHAVIYMAGWVVRNVTTKITCNVCNLLVEAV